MSNEEKTLRYMFAKPMMTDALEEVLKRIGDVSEALHLDPVEFSLVFFIDTLKTAMQTANEVGCKVDVDGLAKSLKEYVYGEK